MCKTIKGNQKHMTLDSRIIIEKELDNQQSLRGIAALLGKDPTAISKEIKKHRVFQEHNRFNEPKNKCELYKDCKRKNICEIFAQSGVRCVITATHIVKILNPEAIIVTNLTKLHSSATAVIKKPTAVWIRPITELLPLTDNIKPYLLNQEMELIYHRKDLKALTVLFLHSLCRDSPHI